MAVQESLPPLRVLFVEDSEDDTLLILHELRRGGYDVVSHRVETGDQLTTALQNNWDIVLSDFNMPQFRGDKALEIVRASKGPDLPFIIISGTIGDERAVALLKAGANDFVVKTNTARLVPTIERELKDALLRKERREAIEGMRRAIEVRDEFLAIASHELKTPVTSLLLQLESLLRLVQASETRVTSASAKIDKVLRPARRLRYLIDRLLDISRVSSGKLEIQRSETDLVQLLTESIHQVQDAATAAKSKIRTQMPASVRGSWDPERVETVLVNLLTNAVKYGGGKPIEVVIEDLGHAALLKVRDYGIGIASEDQARIFGRFERAVSSRHFGGFGVGLWLARQIIEAHGGSIRVESTPGMGSTFEVELPKT